MMELHTKTGTGQFDMMAAPMRVGRVVLAVRDLAAMTDFYRKVLGLAVLARDDETVRLGVGDSVLLELRGDPSLAASSPREAGLFHTAFLLPTRADLGCWLRFALQTGLRIDGASDHIVSEALYLADPEGNGIEIYTDRPAEVWWRADGTVTMSTDPLDAEGLIAAGAERAWSGMPQGSIVGHVHLRVGDTDLAEGFYRDVIGFDLSARYPGGSFFGSGGYHHQLAGNVWNSRGAGTRTPGRTGLASLELIVLSKEDRDRISATARAGGIPVDDSGDALTLRDPWGTEIVLRGA
jgi:catechol 2,3-dioxygenase